MEKKSDKNKKKKTGSSNETEKKVKRKDQQRPQTSRNRSEKCGSKCGEEQQPSPSDPRNLEQMVEVMNQTGPRDVNLHHQLQETSSQLSEHQKLQESMGSSESQQQPRRLMEKERKKNSEGSPPMGGEVIGEPPIGIESHQELPIKAKKRPKITDKSHAKPHQECKKNAELPIGTTKAEKPPMRVVGNQKQLPMEIKSCETSPSPIGSENNGAPPPLWIKGAYSPLQKKATESSSPTGVERSQERTGKGCRGLQEPSASVGAVLETLEMGMAGALLSGGMAAEEADCREWEYPLQGRQHVLDSARRIHSPPTQATTTLF